MRPSTDTATPARSDERGAEPATDDGVDLSLVRWTLSLTPSDSMSCKPSSTPWSSCEVSAAPRFRDALAVLARHQVRHVIVGGVAAVLSGAPIATFDLDIVHARDTANIEALLAALAELDARYRDPGGHVIRPDAPGLSGPGHHLLTTIAGPVDVLGTIVGGRQFDDLTGHCDHVMLDGAALAVLQLAALIEIKVELGRDKDRATLAILRRTLAERGRA
jgi:hypothetical protein